MRKNKTLVTLIQDAIDKGATTVEEIHKSIADLPLKMLQDSGVLPGPAKQAKRVQDHTIGAVYDMIREINEQVGAFASELLAKTSKRAASRKTPRAKKRPAARAASKR